MARDVVGPFEFQLLAAIMALHGNAYGLALRDRLQEQLGRPVSIGSVYTVLERLNGKGLITSDWSAPIAARGGRQKRLFRVNASGEEAYNKFVDRANGWERAAI